MTCHGACMCESIAARQGVCVASRSDNDVSVSRPPNRVLTLAHATTEGQRGEQDEPDFAGGWVGG